MTTIRRPDPGTAPRDLPPLRSLREFDRRVTGCTACSLHRDRTAPVTSQGPADAALMVVSDVPRRHEDLQGRALAGAAANVLDNALLEAGIDPSVVHLATLVRCRPHDDRPLTPAEIDRCGGHLDAQVELVAPKVIVALGELVSATLLGRPVPLERLAGYRFDLRRGITMIPTYHPADVVRGVPRAAEAIGRDLSAAKAVLDGRLPTGAQTMAELRSRMAAGT